MGRHGRAKIVPDHGGNVHTPQGKDQAQDISGQIEHTVFLQLTIKLTIPARGSAITPLIRCDHMIARRRQGQHHLAPAISQFGKTMQQQDAGPLLLLEARLHYVHIKAIHALDGTAADTLFEGSHAICWSIVH